MGNTFKTGNYVNGIFQDASNNIGIGAAPSGTYKLEVTGTAKVSGVATIGTGSQVMGAGLLKLGIASGNAGCALQLLGWSGSYNNWQIDTAYINSAFNITPSTAAGGSTFTTPAFTISSAGNVGIGTTTANAKLDVNSTYASDTTTQQMFRDNTGGGLLFGGTGGAAKWLQAQDYTGAATYYNLLLNPRGGNVGIGTSSPTSKVTITDTGVYGSALNLSEGGFGAWVQGSTEGLTHAFIGNFKYNFTTPSSSFSYYSGTGYGIDMCDGIRFFSAQSNVTNGTFTPTERMRITSAGAVMVGTSSSVNVKGLFVGGTNSSYLNLYSNYSGGAAGMNITNSADVIKVEFFGSSGNYYFAGTNISDRRAKSNIEEITEGLSKISLLKPSTFTYNKNPDIVKGGFIAQEVAEALPKFVTIPEDENEMMGVDYFGILAIAVKAIQELNQQNQDLKSRLDKAGL